MIRAIFFDLDDVLLDTSAERIKALNLLRRENGLSLLPISKVRPYTFYGGPKLVSIAFQIPSGGVRFKQLVKRYFEIYASNLGNDTRPNEGIAELLNALELRKIKWAVITNKPAYLTVPLLDKFGYTGRACAIVCGDTTPFKKPDPRPLLYACAHCEVNPRDCLMLGDAERDIVAAKKAGIHILVCHFGNSYISEDNRFYSDVDGHIRHPLEVLDWLDRL